MIMHEKRLGICVSEGLRWFCFDNFAFESNFVSFFVKLLQIFAQVL